MTNAVGQPELNTQWKVIAFLRDVLGYTYLGNWKDRSNNLNIERELLEAWLAHQGHDTNLIVKALVELEKAAALGGSKSLYDINYDVYEMLRYGVKVQPDVSENNVTVWLIDWENPHNNHFAVAEEVTVGGENTKRPDLVLYVNGIALGVLELKRSTVSVAEGIRQNLDNQKKEFIRPFFSTVQLVTAGNETEGLRYGVIETSEKHWLRWKEEGSLPEAGENPLLKELGQLFSGDRFLEIIHDFMAFDAGTKKVCRPNQYFGVKAAQDNLRRRGGGIIWHTQGSGKSLTMVWLAKWIRENETDARVLIITDRTELDEQIEGVFQGVDEDIYRTKSGADLVNVLNAREEWLIASLIHKFGGAEEGDVDGFLAEIRRNLSPNFSAKGNLFVFVDECHRTHSGKLHDAMKSLLGEEALLIGFTGTPLLKRDKPSSIEKFGPYIHTYKYDEAVKDGVVLDLRYEARDIDQDLTSQSKIDQWFESKTSGLTALAKAQVKQRWGTMRSVQSSMDRLKKIVADIVLDMEIRDRLKSGHGNALLVSGSIYSACRLYDLFQETDLKGRCAIVTSYKPSLASTKGEETGEGLTEKLLQYDVYKKMLAQHFNELEETAIHKSELFEKEVKKRFIEQPAQMKLLIVVDKLLTGFDAPPATYLYIDKPMQDHGLFQAICRVNRLDGDDKEYGYIIDYRDLFKSLEQSISEYTGEALSGYDEEDVKGLLTDRLQQGRQRLEDAREAVKALCEAVDPQRDTAAYLRYFCAEESGNDEQLKANEPKRLTFYRMVAALLRAYANLANEMAVAGYSLAEVEEVHAEVDHYEKVRKEVKLASGDYVDLKMYEPAMRHLLDTYIRAEESEKLADFDELPLVQLIVDRGEGAIDNLPPGIRNSPEALAETIENNVRRLIIDEAAVNPKYYEQMSALLDALIIQRRQEAIEYKEYLERIIELAGKVAKPGDQLAYPERINRPALQAIFDNLIEPVDGADPEGDELKTDSRETKALALDYAIRNVKKADWRGSRIKEREVRNVIKSQLGDDGESADKMFDIVKAQDEY